MQQLPADRRGWIGEAKRRWIGCSQLHWSRPERRIEADACFCRSIFQGWRCRSGLRSIGLLLQRRYRLRRRLRRHYRSRRDFGWRSAGVLSFAWVAVQPLMGDGGVCCGEAGAACAAAISRCCSSGGSLLKASAASANCCGVILLKSVVPVSEDKSNRGGRRWADVAQLELQS